MAFSDTIRAGAAPVRLRTFGKLACAALIAGTVVYLLAQHLAEMDAASFWSAIAAIPVSALALSAGLSALSLYAVSQYDTLALAQLGHVVPRRKATIGGFMAVAIGQTIGFGIVIGSFVRWRVYKRHGLGVTDAALATALVAAGFTAGFAIVLALASLVDGSGLAVLLPGAELWIGLASGLVLVIATAAAILSILQVKVSVLGRRIGLPPLRIFARQVAYAALDLVPAALALWVLLPGGAVEASVLVPIYLAALGVGLVANGPGGLGVLELACLMALPVVPAETLMAALVMHRAIYFGGPALLAAAMLVVHELRGARPVKNPTAVMQRGPVVPSSVEILLATASRPDAALAYLGDKDFVVTPCGQGAAIAGLSGNSLVTLSDPLGPDNGWDRVRTIVEAASRQRIARPFYYKIGADFAAALEASGYRTAQIGVEATLDITSFSLEGSKRRELRRKIRSVEKAGVEIRKHAAGALPHERFAHVAKAWSAGRNGARGFSMGHGCPDYLDRFEVLEAHVDNQPVGFLSLWLSGDGQEGGFDVLRLHPDAPSGTMQALVVEAIEAMRAAGAARFSLGAVPLAGIKEPRNFVERGIALAYERGGRWHGNHGLMRFKAMFRPDLEPRYVAAPGWLALLNGLWDTSRLVNRAGFR